jgi:hypothetical protein
MFLFLSICFKKTEKEIINLSKTDLLISRLTEKCRIQGEPVHTSKGTLELVVNCLYSINSSVRIGVQITDRIQDLPSLREFLSEDEKSETLVDLCAYIEIHPQVYFNDWGAELLYNALVSYAFQKGIREKSIQGIRIQPDVSYEFFDIEEAEY